MQYFLQVYLLYKHTGILLLAYRINQNSVVMTPQFIIGGLGTAAAAEDAEIALLSKIFMT